MSDINDLLTQIQNSIDLANQLSQAPDDNYARSVALLEQAKLTLVASSDRSSECKCQCHILGETWHALPCGCYTGNPVL